MPTDANGGILMLKPTGQGKNKTTGMLEARVEVAAIFVTCPECESPALRPPPGWPDEEPQERWYKFDYTPGARYTCNHCGEVFRLPRTVKGRL